MNARLDSGLLVLSVILAVGGVQRSRLLFTVDTTDPDRGLRHVTIAPAIPSSDLLDDAAATIIANDPFRLANTPPSVRYMSGSQAIAPVAIVRPSFAVRAIIGGPPWSALLEGVPGQSGAIVVSAGNTYERFRIRSISRDTVVVQASDTTWKLAMKVTP